MNGHLHRRHYQRLFDAMDTSAQTLRAEVEAREAGLGSRVDSIVQSLQTLIEERGPLLTAEGFHAMHKIALERNSAGLEPAQKEILGPLSWEHHQRLFNETLTQTSRTATLAP
jgi:hypothetical protein